MRHVIACLFQALVFNLLYPDVAFKPDHLTSSHIIGREKEAKYLNTTIPRHRHAWFFQRRRT